MPGLSLFQKISSRLKIGEYLRAYRAKRHSAHWGEVQKLFRFHSDGIPAMQRLARIWIDNFDLAPIDVFSGRIVEESWSAERIGRLVDTIAQTPHKNGAPNTMITDKKPRAENPSLVVLRTQGREFFLDGRRRANIWRHQDGNYRVWVIEVFPLPAALSSALKQPQKLPEAARHSAR